MYPLPRSGLFRKGEHPYEGRQGGRDMMRIQYLRSTLLLVILLAVTASVPCVCLGAEQLRLVVRADENEIAAGVPFILRIALGANDGLPVEGVPEISTLAGNVHVFIEDLRSGVRKRYLGPQWGTSEREPARVNITPDTPAVAEIPLLFSTVVDGRDDLCASPLPLVPGRYRITVEYLGVAPDSPVTGSIEVAVREPADAAESAYWQAMGTEPALAESLQLGSFARSEELVDKADELMREFPNNANSTMTALALGRHYLYVVRDPQKARGYLEWASRRPGNALVVGRAKYELASAYIAQGLAEQAYATIDEALKTVGTSGLSAELRRLRATHRPSAKRD